MNSYAWCGYSMAVILKSNSDGKIFFQIERHLEQILVVKDLFGVL